MFWLQVSLSRSIKSCEAKKMKFWLGLSLVLLASCHQSQAQEAFCDFQDLAFLGYTCVLTNAEITEPGVNLVINSDNHLAGRNDADVRALTVANSTLMFFPNNLLQQFSSIYYILLEYSGLTTLNPGDFAGCADIGIVNIRHSFIDRIPAGLFADCQNLYIIDFTDNNISEIHEDAFENLSSVLEVVLDQNAIHTIPTDLFRDMVSLEELYISDNQISVIEDRAFAMLINLITFYLRNNQLTEIRSQMFGNQISVVNLNLNENQLTSVPHLPSRASRLRYIYLMRNNIQEIVPGDFVFDFADITNIELSENNIRRLSAPPFQILSNLDVLSLNFNQIEAIDHELLNIIPSLNTLNLEGNVCANVRFNNMRNNNQDATISRALDRCYYHFFEANTTHTCNFVENVVYGYSCELTQVNFQTFRDKFDLDGQHLRDLSYIDVTDLLITNGNMNRIPPSIFDHFLGLQSLRIINSEIRVIDQKTFERCGMIRHLDLSSNRIRRLLPRSFENCNNVEELILDNNQITEIAPCNNFLSNIYQTRRLSMRNNVCVNRFFDDPYGNWLIYEVETLVYPHLNRCFSLYYLFLDTLLD